MNKEPQTLIEVVGLPGSGKTTLSHKLADSLSAEWIDLDLFEQNPFFKVFPENPPKYAFSTGLFFSHSRSQQSSLVNQKLLKNTVVMDHGFDLGLYLYSFNSVRAGRMTQDEWQFLEQLHQYFLEKEQAPKVDVTVWLEVPVETLIQRIIDRGRSHEVSYQEPFLRALYESYQLFKQKLLKDRTRQTLMVVDVNKQTISVEGQPMAELEKILAELF